MQTDREISYWAAFPWKALVIATVCVLGSLACAAPVPQTDIEALAAAEMQQITDHPATDIEPKWSPNSERLAFASDRDGGLDVYTVEVEGGKPTRLTEGMKFVHSTWWSPSGGSLVMSAGAKTWDRDIFLYLVSVPGGEMRPLTNGPIDGSPCWSPDGKKIAFVSNRSGHFDLWVIPAEGGEAVQITDFEGLDHSPRWSPDGSRLAFHSRRSGNEDIWITPAAAGESTQLTRSPANDSYACLLYTSDAADECPAV